MIKLKSAYLLCRLRVDYSKNVRFIVDEADPLSKDKRGYDRTNAIMYLGLLIGEGDKELLPKVFKVVLEADGAVTQNIHGIFYSELAKSTKTFLQYLSKESKGNKKAVYELISFDPGYVSNEEIEKIKVNLTNSLSDKEVKDTARAVLKAIQNRK